MAVLRKVLSKYQITLPKEAVKRLNIRQGDLVQCEVENNRLILSPVQVSPRGKTFPPLPETVSGVRDQPLRGSGELRIISELKKKILSVGREKVRRILLYGSRARGEATPGSDFDLLVVEKDPVSKREEARLLRRQVKEVGVPADVRVMGETEFQETRGIIGGIAYPASKEGIVLYEVA